MKKLFLVLLFTVLGCTSSVPRTSLSLEFVDITSPAVAALVNAEDGLNSKHKIYCTGSFISRDHVLTAQHCVDGVSEIRVGTYDQFVVTEGEFTNQHWRRYTTVKENADTDLAVLKLSDDRGQVSHTVMSLAERAPKVGENVVVVGHPVGLGWSFSTGMVSFAKRKGWGDESPEDSVMLFVQHQAPAFFGNSGGPLLDMNGNQVGVLSMIVRGASHISMSIHLSAIKEFLQEEGNNV